MFDEPFAHYVSYGATDQKTILELRGLIDGLLVPGTVAAFQHAGTGGFVLTLSATVEGMPYVIDSRFPLFQQALPNPKRSHVALAELLGTPELIRNTDPAPGDFAPELIERLAASWVEFNEAYRGSAGAKFDKYAKRLREQVSEEAAERPQYVLAPYVFADDAGDPWWTVSKTLYDVAAARSSSLSIIRVLAVQRVQGLHSLLADVPDERVALWVSGLNELDSPASDLSAYLDAIAEAAGRGKLLFALYGGFFGVLAGSVGLRGESHGIGFGEYRSWPELPRSGPPPARYYLTELHRYVSQEDAQRLHMASPELVACGCSQCGGREPIELDYHELMKHSVACRATEINKWPVLSPDELVSRLEQERDSFLERLTDSAASDLVWAKARRYSDHFPRWIEAFRRYIGPA